MSIPFNILHSSKRAGRGASGEFLNEISHSCIVRLVPATCTYMLLHRVGLLLEFGFFSLHNTVASLDINMKKEEKKMWPSLYGQ